MLPHLRSSAVGDSLPKFRTYNKTFAFRRDWGSIVTRGGLYQTAFALSKDDSRNAAAV